MKALNAGKIRIYIFLMYAGYGLYIIGQFLNLLQNKGT